MPASAPLHLWHFSACGIRGIFPAMRAALLFCLLLMGLDVARGATATNTAKFNLAVDRANKAIQAGKFTEAEKEIDVAGKLQPDAAEIPNLRGVLLTREQRYAEAVEKFNQALALDPKFYPAKFNLAELALMRGNISEALQRYQELENVDRSSEVVQFKVAICYLLLGDEAKARAVTDIIPIPGNTPAYYYARAAAWFRKGNWSQVDHYVATAHKYYPDGRCAYFEASLREVGLDLAKRNPAAAPSPLAPSPTPSSTPTPSTPAPMPTPSLTAPPAASSPTPSSPSSTPTPVS
jgi:tetratricopeptide (TPR) repeat protein